jgi:orotidine-5'-phosphate decarboxylase
VDQLLIALDVDTTEGAVAMASTLRGVAGGLKIGSRLFTAEGPKSVRRLVEHGDRVFLDLKFHDIPTIVAGAVRSAVRLGVWMMTLHTAGGAAMMRAALEAAEDEAARLGRPRPLIAGVTVLTSLDSKALPSIGVVRPLLDHVDALAALALDARIDGVVASPHEIARIRQRCGPGFLIVTPGIRPTSAQHEDDQARTMSAAQALEAGADYLVVGRPVLAAADPRAAAEALAAEISAAHARR